MKKLLILSILFLQGCAITDLQTKDIKLRTITLFKDVRFDPNNPTVISVVSPEGKGLVEAIGGALIGFAVGIGF